MKKLSLLLIVLCSYSLFAQLEGVPVSDVITIRNGNIPDDGLYVPEGKIWNVISRNNVNAYFPNSNIKVENFNSVNFLTEGYYFKYTEGCNTCIFNAIEYDLSAQQLSHAEPKIDNRPTLFPNPTNSMLSLNSDKNYKIQVFDLNGRKLMEQNGNIFNMEHLI